MICHQVTLSGDAEWPKVADAVIEAGIMRTDTLSRTPRRLALLDAIAESDRDITELELLNRHVVFLNERELIRKVLITHAVDFEKSDFQHFVMGRGEGLLHGLGNGLLTSSNAVHKDQHRFLTPLFAPARMRSYAKTMLRIARDHVRQWVHGSTVELGAEFMSLAVRIIAATLLSKDFGSQLPRVVAWLSRITGGLGRSYRERSLGWSDPCDIESAIRGLDALLRDVVEKRKGHARGGGDLIDVLLRAQAETAPSSTEGYVVSDQQIMDDVMTMVMTGSENPRNALSWTMYLLGEHPEVYEQARRAVLQQPRHTHLARAPLRAPTVLHLVQEALRLYPPGYAFGRRTLRDLDLGAVRLPQGAEVVMSPYVLHRRERYFSQPREFIPTRFAAGSARLPRYAYLPFGAGPRACIGGAYALLACQIVLTVVLRDVRLVRQWTQPIAADPLMTLRPSGPLPVAVDCGQP
jgi:cytochrome P450